MLLSGVICLLGASSAVAVKYSQSPILDTEVAMGKLPSVEERLPEEPFVVGPDILVPEEYLDFEAGKYGGTIRLAYLEWVDPALFCLESILRPNNPVGSKGSRPGIVSDFKMSDDNKDFSFTIRKGIKWSDGVPVTTEDIRFLFEDVYSNPDSRYGWPTELKTQGKPDGAPPEWEIIDKYTFTLSYDLPYGYLHAGLSSWIWGYRIIFQPSHYLKQFHADYTPIEELEARYTEAMKEWGHLFITKVLSVWDFVTNRANLGVPVLTAWIPTEYAQDRITWTRNPYFWMVDTAGNQLPYCDYVQAWKMTDLEAIKLRVLAGNVDFYNQSAIRELPLYIQYQKTGNYTILASGSINNAEMLCLNQDYGYDDPDSTWQKIVGDDEKRHAFGTALALAIDKEDVNKVLYFGWNGLPTTTPSDYDPTKTNQLLDEIGMDKLDSEGFRLGPDGKRFELRITQGLFSGNATLVPLAELLKSYFEEVGVRTSIKVVSDQLYGQLAGSGQIMAVINWADEPMWTGGISRDYQPNSKGNWAQLSWLYYDTGGEGGRKPPPYMEEYFKLNAARDEFAPGSPQGEAAYKALMNWFSQNLPYIFPTQQLRVIRIVSNRLGNVPLKAEMPYDRIDHSFIQLFVK